MIDLKSAMKNRSKEEIGYWYWLSEERWITRTWCEEAVEMWKRFYSDDWIIGDTVKGIKEEKRARDMAERYHHFVWEMVREALFAERYRIVNGKMRLAVELDSIRTNMSNRFKDPKTGKMIHWCMWFRSKLPLFVEIYKGHPGKYSEIEMNATPCGVVAGCVNRFEWDNSSQLDKTVQGVLGGNHIVTPIDVENIQEYIDYMDESVMMNEEHTVDEITEDIVKLHMLVEYVKTTQHVSEGSLCEALPQEYTVGAYGRTYLKGFNLQTMRGDLRHIALGPCWRYDLQTGVYSGCAALADRYGIAAPRIQEMWQDRSGVRHRMACWVYDTDEPTEQQLKTIKGTFMCVGFRSKGKL